MANDISVVVDAESEGQTLAAVVRVAMEVEYTSADYGSNYNEFYIPETTTNADNLRVLAAIYYFF